MLVTKAIDKIMIGGDSVTINDLVISKLLGQSPKEEFIGLIDTLIDNHHGKVGRPTRDNQYHR